MSSAAALSGSSALETAGSAHQSTFEPSPGSIFGGSVGSGATKSAPRTPTDDLGAVTGNLANLIIPGKSNVVPVKLYSPPFIRNALRSGVDDPFGPSSSGRGTSQRSPTGSQQSSRAALSNNWRSGGSNETSSGTRSPSAAGPLSGTSFPGGNFSGVLTAADAQSYFPPSSCVFVANLLQSESDEALQYAVTQVFREFGTVYVKIRRDSKHMPFAFCQYTNDQDAQNAIKNGRGRLIRGRPCRCEKAKANRLFFFQRIYGPSVTEVEALAILQVYGKIENIYPATLPERDYFRIGEGIMVQFKMYDEGQAALQAFRGHDVYNMQSLAGSPAYNTPSRPDPAHRIYLQTYEVDTRSIFVGQLPPDTFEEELEQKFEHCGQILRVTVHKNDSLIDASQKHCFAFIEFADIRSSHQAIEKMNATNFRGKTLRVSQKNTEAAKARSIRRQVCRPAPLTSTGARPYQTPVTDRGFSAHLPSPATQMSPPFGPPLGQSPGMGYQHYGNGFDHGSYYYYPGSYSSSPGLPSPMACSIASSPTQSGYNYGGFPAPVYPHYPNYSPVYPPVYPPPTYFYPPYGQTGYEHVGYVQPGNPQEIATNTSEETSSTTPDPVSQNTDTESSLVSQ